MMDFPGISTFVKTGIFKEKMVILDNTFGSKNTVELQLPLCLGNYSRRASTVEKSDHAESILLQ